MCVKTSHLIKINLNFSSNSKCLFPLPIQGKPYNPPPHPPEAAHGSCKAGWEGKMRGRTAAYSLWQLSKCWLFLWLRTHVGLFFRATECLPDGAKPLWLASSNSPTAPALIVCAFLIALVPLRVLCLSPPTGWLVGEGWCMGCGASLAFPQQVLQGWSGFLLLNEDTLSLALGPQL